MIFVGLIPVPTQTPPLIVFDEVTYGKVPWSISRSVPCAPSKRIFLLCSTDSYNSIDTSLTYFAMISNFVRQSFNISS